MDQARYIAVMAAAGVGIPLLAALNARLGVRIGSPAAAAAVLFAVALVCALAAVWATGGAGGLARLRGQPPVLFLGGALVAFYVLSVTYVAPHFGLGNAILCVLLGQMMSAAVIDHFGLFGALERPVTPLRLCGLAAMVLGLVMARAP